MKYGRGTARKLEIERVDRYSGKILVQADAASPKEFASLWLKVLTFAQDLGLDPMTDGFQGYNDETFNDDGS